MINKTVLIIIIVVIVWFLFGRDKKETFLDPYSIDLHREAVYRQAWWDRTHRKPFFYLWYYVPQHYKE